MKKIRFDEILPEGLRLHSTEDDWFPREEVAQHGSVTVELFLERLGSERVLLSGRLLATVGLGCDRCLREYEVGIDRDFRIDLEYTEKVSQVRGEHNCSDFEMDTVFIEQPEIDLDDLLHQQLLLSLPDKRLCGEGCRGLCSFCGADLNEESCGCHGKQSSSPFGILAGLKGK